MTDIEEPEGVLPDDDSFGARIQAGRNKRIAAKGGTRVERTAAYIGEHPWKTAAWGTVAAVVTAGTVIGVGGALVGNDDAPDQKNTEGQEQTDPGFNPGGGSSVPGQDQGQDQGQTQGDGSGNLPGGNPLDSAVEPLITSTTVAPSTVPPVPNPELVDAIFDCEDGVIVGSLDPRGQGLGDGNDNLDMPVSGTRACTNTPGQDSVYASLDGGSALLKDATTPGAIPAPEMGL